MGQTEAKLVSLLSVETVTEEEGNTQSQDRCVGFFRKACLGVFTMATHMNLQPFKLHSSKDVIYKV